MNILQITTIVTQAFSVGMYILVLHFFIYKIFKLYFSRNRTLKTVSKFVHMHHFNVVKKDSSLAEFLVISHKFLKSCFQENQ